MIANSYFGRLYTRLRFHFGCKLKLPNGEFFRRGTTPQDIWFTWDAVSALDAQRTIGCGLLNKYFRDEIVEAIGRPLEPADIRMSFQPEYYYTPDGFLSRGLSAVFLDDVSETIPAHILVETSPGNWQAHFRVSRDFKNDEDIKCIQKYLRHIYNADAGAVSAKHPRRFASPAGSGLTSIVNHLPPLDRNKILAEAKAFEAGQPSPVRNYQSHTGTLTYQSVSDSTCCGVWDRALDRAHQDKSNADFALGIYMAARGYQEDEIQAAIIRIRGDELFQKKGSDAHRYLEHTARRAVERATQS